MDIRGLVQLVQLLQFTNEKILKPRAEKLENLPQITHFATVVGTNRTRTQILSILSTLLYWYLIGLFRSLCFSILKFFFYKSCIKLMQVRPIGEVLTSATERKIPS